MTELEATLSIRAGGAVRRVRLSEYLDPEGEENAARQAHAWIKSLRHARVDGVSFRERFTYLGDSLWWFAELYLHKERAILSLFRALNATESLLEREQPDAIWLDEGAPLSRLIVEQTAAARQIQYDGPPAPKASRFGWLRMDARSTALTFAAIASPDRPFRTPRFSGITVATFVHRAFWRGNSDEGSAESYIGPVLQALEQQLRPEQIRHVGVGPATNFRARRWWRRGRGADVVQPIEQLTPRDALAGSSGVWMARHAMRRSLAASADLRSAALIRGCDCWPIVLEAFNGIALLQFPWSARAMDEAGAALDALQPAAALTYAEAGGWGRALAVEARRRGIPLAGLQHGFIYRHWLNYLHEPDETRPVKAGSADAGFPFPRLTLVFDEFARRHLVDAGGFPSEGVAVSGSPRLDVLAERFRSLARDDVESTRTSAGAGSERPLVLLVTKYSEVRAVLPRLLAAFEAMPDAQLAIKTHPAETPAPYEHAAAGLNNVRVLPASADLASLLRAARAVITVNSTVALDALALGVPALSIGLPNNLSPFVTAGAIAGADASAGMEEAIRRLLYDEGFRQRLSTTAAGVVEEYRMAPDGQAAERCASAILRLAGRADRQSEE